jgi:hypothetical protein
MFARHNLHSSEQNCRMPTYKFPEEVVLLWEQVLEQV